MQAHARLYAIMKLKQNALIMMGAVQKGVLAEIMIVDLLLFIAHGLSDIFNAIS